LKKNTGIKMADFEEPNRKNVSDGDYLLGTGNFPFPCEFFIIYERGEKELKARILAGNSSRFMFVEYGNAVVVTKEGKMLVGRNVLNALESALQGEEKIR
jgi:hypothetical protein